MGDKTNVLRELRVSCRNPNWERSKGWGNMEVPKDLRSQRGRRRDREKDGQGAVGTRKLQWLLW